MSVKIKGFNGILGTIGCIIISVLRLVKSKADYVVVDHNIIELVSWKNEWAVTGLEKRPGNICPRKAFIGIFCEVSANPTHN